MSGFLYGTVIQFKLDIRSRALLITCYVVPLLFYVIMGGIFISVTPQVRDTLVQSMTVLGVSTGALVGLPPSVMEVYGSDIRKVYKANGAPLYMGLISMLLSAFTHLMVMSAVIFVSAPVLFDAALPEHPLRYFGLLAVFIAVSLSVGGVLGLAVGNQAKLTMFSQVLYMPSLMLTGILFPADMLPVPLEYLGRALPASWGFRLLAGKVFEPAQLLPLALIFIAAAAVCCFLLSRKARG